jgi:protein O-mannosyl-transferase
VFFRLRAALIVLGIAVCYGPALPFPFVFDDRDAVQHNATLASPVLALTPPLDTPVTGRPVVNLSFAIDRLWAGEAPLGYRLVNLCIHAGNAWLVLLLLSWAFAREGVAPGVRAHAREWALGATLLWALHPLQTETVIYVTQRTELLASTSLLLVLHAARLALQEGAARHWMLLAVAACVLGTGCKETVIVAPVLVLLLDRAFFSPSLVVALRKHAPLYGGLMIAELPLLVQVLSTPRGDTAGLGLGISPLQSLAVQGAAIAWYLRLSAWPSPLSIVYNWPVHDAIPRYLAQDALLIVIFVVAVVTFVRKPKLGLPAFAFFVLLAPSSSVIPVLTELVAERRMYLPLLCVVVLTIVGLCALFASRAGAVRACAWVLGVACLACVARTSARVQDFRTEITLWRSALRAAPDNPLAMWGLGNALDDAGRPREALAYFERMASERFPYVGPSAWGTRGLFAASTLHARQGDPELAARTRQRALEYAPESTIGRLYDAAQLARAGKAEASAAALESMLHDQPFLHARIHRELASLLLHTGGDRRRALHHLQTSLRLAPTDEATLGVVRQLSAGQ